MGIRNQILTAGARQVQKVPAPGLGGEVFIRQLSGAEAAQLPLGLAGQDLTYAIAAASLCEEDGSRLASPITHAELLELGSANCRPLIKAALDLNLMSKEANDTARKD